MRAQLWVLGAAALALAPLDAWGRSSEAVTWHTNVQEAQRMAAETNRLVVLHFWAPWCGPCMRLDREVLNEPGVAKALDEHYVLVKLNYDENSGLAQRYGVQVIPTDVVVTPDGKLVRKLQSAPTLDRYTGQLTQVALEVGARQPAAQVAAIPAGPSASAASAPEMAPIAPQPPAARGTGDRYSSRKPRLTEQAPIAAPNARQTTTTWSERPIAVSEPGLQRPENESAAVATAASAEGPAASVGPEEDFCWVPGSQPEGGSSEAAETHATRTKPAIVPMNAVPEAAISHQVTLPPANTAAGNPPLGLDGYCPVHLAVNQRWEHGDPRWGAIHRGRTYLFVSESCQKEFLADPDRFSPVLSGNDPVAAVEQGQALPGRREFGVFYEGRVYLFASAATRDAFEHDPSRYAQKVLTAQ